MSKLRILLPEDVRRDLKVHIDYDEKLMTNLGDKNYLNKYNLYTKTLPPRNSKDSYLEGIVPLSNNKNLQNEYVSFSGEIRIDKLLEDMDSFAVLVAKKHILIPFLPDDVPSSFSLVTACIDKIEFMEVLTKPTEDLKYSGQVTWVGKSTIEVVVNVEQKINNIWNIIATSLFLFAARDATCTNALHVNQLSHLTKQEKKIFDQGEIRRNNRLRNSLDHFSKKVPTLEEQSIIHKIFLESSETQDSPSNDLSTMDKFTLFNYKLSGKEEKNFNDTVFGGFIVGSAAELASILAFKFTKHRPFLKYISDVSFDIPIEINTIIKMEAHLVYSYLNYYQIIVFVKVLDCTKSTYTNTVTLHFTFHSFHLVKQVYPKTYEEAMLYIDGKRHLDFIIADNENTLQVKEYLTVLKRASKL